MILDLDHQEKPPVEGQKGIKEEGENRERKGRNTVCRNV